MSGPRQTLQGAGLGFRRAFLPDILEQAPPEVDFYEIAPENWLNLGGKLGKQFRAMTEKHRFVCHGLSLSIGSSDALDEALVLDIKQFMRRHGIEVYSEHLSYCSHNGHLYDLMPLPFTQETVAHVAARVRRVQELMEQRIALENVSYYAAPEGEMSESAFFNAVIREADCDVHLDLNNIYVNSVNHGYDAAEFLAAVPGERIVYAHMAGHYQQAPDLLIDTHGAPIIDPVWALLQQAYRQFGVFPTLLERDFNIPPMAELVAEVAQIRRLQQQVAV
jgi:uncharacterized protein